MFSCFSLGVAAIGGFLQRDCQSPSLNRPKGIIVIVSNSKINDRFSIANTDRCIDLNDRLSEGLDNDGSHRWPFGAFLHNDKSDALPVASLEPLHTIPMNAEPWIG